MKDVIKGHLQQAYMKDVIKGHLQQAYMNTVYIYTTNDKP